MNKPITVNQLLELCKKEIIKGNGNKFIMISQDDEGNGYHYLWYPFSDGNNVLSEREYDALDYHMTYAKLYDSGLYIKQELNRGDYFVDEQEGCEYSLDEGLEIIAETIIPENYIFYPSEINRTLYRLYMDRLGIFIWDRNFDKKGCE